MKKLWVFGCSFTAPFFDWNNHDGSESSYTKYRKFLGGEFPLTWSEILAKDLGYELKNYAGGGNCNYIQYHRFCEVCDQIEKDDLVIFQWTHVYRFLWVMNRREMCNVTGPWQFNSMQALPSTLEEIYVNRSFRPWVDEVYLLQKLMNQLAKVTGFKLFHWSACDEIINSETEEFKKDKNFLIKESNESVITYLSKKHGGLTITHETKDNVFDAHYGGEGHKVLASIILDEIKDKI